MAYIYDKDKENQYQTAELKNGEKPNTYQTAELKAGQGTGEIVKTSLNGVDAKTQEKMDSQFQASDNVTNWDNKTNQSYSNLESLTNKQNIVSQGVKDTINSQFVIPSAVTEADAYIADQLQKIQSGKTSYSDQVRDMMDKILNREKFSYDVDTDPLFQQALASAMNSGKTAMQDTIGQASALTGGYGSTYATTAGNQAYNAFIEDAYDNLPQYYQMALEAYQMEGDEMYRQYGMLSAEDDKEFNRNVTAYDATYQHRNRMYDEAYQQFRDTKSDAFGMANLQLSEHSQQVSDAYNLYNASSNMADKLYEREYSQWADQVNLAYQYAEMLNSDYWNQTNFDEGVRQYEKNYAQTEDHFTRTQEFQSAESQKQRDWQSSEADKDRNFQASENAKNRAVKSSSGSGVGGYELSTSEISTIKKAFEDGGWDSVVDTLAALGKPIQNDEQAAMVDSIVTGNSNGTSNVGKSVESKLDKFRTTKGDNFDIEINGTDYRVENKGKVTDEDTIKGLNKVGASNGSALLYNGDAYVKYADGYYKVGSTSILGISTSGYQNLLKAMQK